MAHSRIFKTWNVQIIKRCACYNTHTHTHSKKITSFDKHSVYIICIRHNITVHHFRHHKTIFRLYDRAKFFFNINLSGYQSSIMHKLHKQIQPKWYLCIHTCILIMYQQIITHKVIKLWLSTLVWEIIHVLISEYINIIYKSFIKYVHRNTTTGTCKTKEVISY